jgi:type II secretory ATPase GspE/PulE/Tfp pilus assembly ATPase PilB-like protein
MDTVDRVTEELGRGNQCSIITLLNLVINSAYDAGSSDIHLQPGANGTRVRIRVDGLLRDAYRFPDDVYVEAVARIKVLANMRTDEHVVPQDGRFSHCMSNGTVGDVRVSIAPAYFGENVVLRLLFSRVQDGSLETLGFTYSAQEDIRSTLERPGSMILVTGPTGSGKTTTLYTLMKMMHKPEVSLVSIEDPIEYAIEGVEQLQVNAQTGFTFANGLRTILRQDPDIIMVGEIRDSETASIAINAALTGHLLLSTLHTNSAAATLPRLRDLGVEQFLIDSTLSLVINQRLIRTLCIDCREAYPATAQLVESLLPLNLTAPILIGELLYKTVGCGTCSGSGYVGRRCISEVLIIGQTTSATLLENGFARVRIGETTPEEVLRVARK